MPPKAAKRIASAAANPERGQKRASIAPDAAGETAEATGETPSYWLLKEEPDAFSIDDLANKEKQQHVWCVERRLNSALGAPGMIV